MNLAHLLHRTPARVIPLTRLQIRLCHEARQATRERCRHLQLDAADTARCCLACTAAVIRDGRSAATAYAEGVAEAKRRAGLRTHGSSSPRPAA